jgi:hypothetical protein
MLEELKYDLPLGTEVYRCFWCPIGKIYLANNQHETELGHWCDRVIEAKLGGNKSVPEMLLWLNKRRQNFQ